MDLLLKNKTAFVSGSTAGIGYAIAKGFAKEGAIVYIMAGMPVKLTWPNAV
ncbi:hypothetical protein [Xanthocytophaga flava]|uniref:hypothetical protein n=1 Tax=Xanthocytophaga flava TaxID=3048013 RepID=UPI0028D00176|nr:hypothetical protein [Xanthocytophaga flavus]MDJ1471580.1 hypothetical protein [Xanthocytophaga flavus]